MNYFEFVYAFIYHLFLYAVTRKIKMFEILIVAILGCIMTTVKAGLRDLTLSL